MPGQSLIIYGYGQIWAKQCPICLAIGPYYFLTVFANFCKRTYDSIDPQNDLSSLVLQWAPVFRLASGLAQLLSKEVHRVSPCTWFLLQNFDIVLEKRFNKTEKLVIFQTYQTVGLGWIESGCRSNVLGSKQVENRSV